MTIKEVAKLAGTSPATISRVINNSGYVKKEVRERVEKIIEETGYRPNAFAKALHQKKSSTIGVILPKINASSSGDTVSGITEIASKKGYSILLGNTSHSQEKEIEFLNLFKEKQVDGIILVATIITEKHKIIIDKLNIPLVIVGQDSKGIAPCVVFDEEKAAYDMAAYMIESGKEKLAFIGVDESDIAVGGGRKAGYKKALKKNKILLKKEYIENGAFTVESGYEACKKIWEKNNNKPQGIFASTDKMAIGAINYLLDIGLDVPKDIAVSGIGGGFLSKYYKPRITTLFYDYKKSGIKSAKLLFDLIDKKEVKQRVVIEHKLIKQESA